MFRSTSSFPRLGRSLASASLLLGLRLLSTPTVAVAAPASTPPVCAHASINSVEERVTCSFVGVGAPRRYRLEVRFIGSHDDTSASIAATVDEQPRACAAGSKTSLFAEDGNVELHCRVVIDGPVGVPQELALTVNVTHAQYADFDLTAE